MMAAQSIQKQAIEVSADYLGPAAERFINRQITIHLHKKPEKLTKSDLPKLVDWVKIAFALLTDDGSLVDEYVNRLLNIGKSRKNEKPRR